MNRLKEELLRYKWLWLIGIVIALGMGVLAANIHVVQFITWRAQGDTDKIIQLLKRDIKRETKQADWHFQEGIKYLLEDASKESLDFLEEHLGELTPKGQYDVIGGYNKKNLMLKDHKIFMQLFMKDLSQGAVQSYLKRIDPIVLDQELFYYFGNDPEITEEFINTLYHMLSIYPKQLPLMQFQFKLYPILILDENDETGKKGQIFEKLDSSKAQMLLFKELKTKPIDMDELSRWIEFLHNHKVLLNKDYADFTKIYREFQIVRTQYMGMDEKEVDLKNKKQMIEVELGDKLASLETNEGRINGLKYDILGLEKELQKLTDYAHMAFYIGKSYGNGEYEASVPKKSFFGNYTASSQKYVLKLNTTTFYQEGIYYLDVYLNGTKIGTGGKEYPYYIEVPKENLERMNTLARSREQQLQELEELTKQTAILQKEVDTIKKENGYEENEAQLQNLDKERESLRRKIDEKIVQVKNLFELGDISMHDL